MKRNLLILSALVMGLAGTNFAMAQDKPDVPSKANSPVKLKMLQKDCEEARKAGKVVEGECKPDVPPGKVPTTTTLKMSQKDCLEARKAGKVVEGECQP